MRFFGHLAGFSLILLIYRLNPYFITAVNGICVQEHLLHGHIACSLPIDSLKHTLQIQSISDTVQKNYAANSIYL